MSGYYLKHSAKGTTWKDHKYVKKENGVYYYKTAKEKSDKNEKITKNNGSGDSNQQIGNEGWSLEGFINDKKDYYQNLANEKISEFNQNSFYFITNPENRDTVVAVATMYARKYAFKPLKEFCQEMDSKIDQGKQYVNNLITAGANQAIQNIKDTYTQSTSTYKPLENKSSSNTDWTKKR